MRTQAQLTADLNTVADQVVKVNGEIADVQGHLTLANAEIARLTQIISAGGEITPELEAAFDRLRTNVQAADDKMPDAVPVPSPEPAPAPEPTPEPPVS